MDGNNEIKTGLESLQKHFAEGFAIAVVAATKKGAAAEERAQDLIDLGRIIHIAHFDKNEITGCYQEDDGSITEEKSFAMFAVPERAKELWDLVYGIGKKYNREVMLYGVGGKLKYIHTIADEKLGTEIDIGEEIGIEEIVNFYTRIGGRPFKLKKISADIEHRYGSFVARVISDQWDELYKKYGKDTLEMWEKN